MSAGSRSTVVFGRNCATVPSDVVDVDEHLEPRPSAERTCVLVGRPGGVHDGELGAAASQTDIAWLTLGGQLEVPGEPELFEERGRGRHCGGEDGWKCAVGHGRRLTGWSSGGCGRAGKRCCRSR